MKYICIKGDCGKEFLHTAKLIVEKPGDTVIEYSVCPHCNSIEFDHLIEEPPVMPDITSVKSVPLDKVDEWLGQGYIVESMYAKTATLVKRE